MHCPFPGCATNSTRVIDKRDPTQERGAQFVPKKFGGQNIIRRRRECRFGHRFHTIEMPEAEYEFLISERGRLEPILPNMRKRGNV